MSDDAWLAWLLESKWPSLVLSFLYYNESRFWFHKVFLETSESRGNIFCVVKLSNSNTHTHTRLHRIRFQQISQILLERFSVSTWSKQDVWTMTFFVLGHFLKLWGNPSFVCGTSELWTLKSPVMCRKKFRKLLVPGQPVLTLLVLELLAEAFESAIRSLVEDRSFSELF